MSATLLQLASPIFLAIATFRRKARRGTPLTGDEVREDITRLFREQEQRAEVESGLSQAWQQAKRPLVYLVDEVMMNTEWEYRGWWSDHSLEVALLNHPQKMRGIKFFDELAAARTQFEQQRQSPAAASGQAVDLMTVFYCCLRFGFEGKYAGQPQELQQEAEELQLLLPSAARGSERLFFPDAYAHTVEIPPNYETVMRVASIVALLIGMVALFIGFREVLRNELIDELKDAADAVGALFSA